MKYSLIILLVSLLAGCGTVGPALYNGRYYMIDDGVCVKWKEHIYYKNSMMCMDKDGKDIGYVNPMSDQQVQMYLGSRNDSTPSSRYCYTSNGSVTCF